MIISGDVNGVAFACPSGATTCSVPLSEGVGSANYRVDASSTGLFATGNATYLLDTSTPQLNGSANGVVGTNGWYKSDVTVSVTPSDTISGIASTTVTVDGGAQSIYSAPITVSDGIHTVTLSTTDNAGNIAQTTQTFYIDTVTPVLNVSLSGSMGLNNWYISNVNVTLTASDTGSGMALLEASIDGSAFTNYQAPITFSDGIHSYQFRATDNAGNITQTAVQQIKVDTTTPAVSLKINGTRGQNDWYVSDVTVTPTASDGGAGVGLLEALVDGGSWTVVNAPLSFSDGIHDYQIHAIDNAGNETLIPIQQVKVDTVYPVIAMDDELKLGETLYYDLEDPVIRSAQVSGLWINRHVIQDDAEKYKKVAWQEDISGQKFQGDILWDGKFSDGMSAEVGEYFITLKISDAAGNETMQTAIIKVNALSFLQIIPPFTPPQTTTLPAQTTQTDSAAVTEFGGTNSGATSTESTSTTSGGTVVFNSDTDYIQSGFTQRSETTSTPITNTNILWGATAAAMLGATLADWQRKREEEEARKRAEAASQEQGGGGSGKKTPGQIAYEKMMQQKHIVGASQALLNEKAKEKAEQAEQARQNLIAKNEDKAPIDMAKVNQLVEEESARQALIAKNEDKAPVDVAKVQQLVEARQEEEKPSGNWLSNLWNAGVSAVGSVLSPGNVGGGGLLSVRDGDPPPPSDGDKSWLEEQWDNFVAWWNEPWPWEKPVPTSTPNLFDSAVQTAWAQVTQTAQAMPTATITPPPTVTSTPSPWYPLMNVPLFPGFPPNLPDGQIKPEFIKVYDNNTNLCGEMVLAMIAAGLNGNQDNLPVIYKNAKPYLVDSNNVLQNTGLYAQELLLIALEDGSLPGTWSGTAYSWENSLDIDKFGVQLPPRNNVNYSQYENGNVLRDLMMNGDGNIYIIPLVQLDPKNGYQLTITNDLKDNNSISHWVLVTGFSSQWDTNNLMSPNNQVQINNPYNNSVETYPWSFFAGSMQTTPYSQPAIVILKNESDIP